MRKEFRQLTEDERLRFGDAVVTMATTIVDPDEDPDTSQYDLFVRMHQPCNAIAAHGGPAFLPWHREYLMRFESALQAVDANVTIPYWDSTIDQPLPTVTDSVLWDDDYLGNTNGNVTTGERCMRHHCQSVRVRE